MPTANSKAKSTAKKTAPKITVATGNASVGFTGSAADKDAVKTPKTAAKTTGKSVRKTAGRSKKVVKITPEQRRHYIEVAAYYIAERRGFVGERHHEDWAEAEAEIGRLLAESLLDKES